MVWVGRSSMEVRLELTTAAKKVPVPDTDGALSASTSSEEQA